MKKRIYISAPITGHDLAERKEYFAEVAEQLEEAGYEPVNPFDNGLPDTAPRTEHMKADLKMLLSCDGYVQSVATHGSIGCVSEAGVALLCGIPAIALIKGSTLYWDLTFKENDNVKENLR